MPRRITSTVLMSLISLFGLQGGQTEKAHDRAYLVSLIRVIADPKLFDGRRLRIEGYLAHNGLDRAVGIYVTEPDGQNFVISNSIDLKIDVAAVEKFIGQYVILEGTYHAPKTGPLTDYLNGYFDHISRPEPSRRRDIPTGGQSKHE